jgi:hypothetical protein
MFMRDGTPSGLRITSTGGAVLEERHVLLGDDLGDHALVAVAARELVALGDLALLGHEHPHQVVDPRRQVVAAGPRERLDVDHHAALAVRHLQRRVADLARLLLEDRADQLLLRRQLRLALRRDLADQQVARLHLGADAARCRGRRGCAATPRAVRDVAGDLLVAQLGRCRASISYSSMWIEVSSSSLTSRCERMIASSKL